MTCRTCTASYMNDGVLECRRHPPQANAVSDWRNTRQNETGEIHREREWTIFTYFPRISPDDHCVEYIHQM